MLASPNQVNAAQEQTQTLRTALARTQAENATAESRTHELQALHEQRIDQLRFGVQHAVNQLTAEYAAGQTKLQTTYEELAVAVRLGPPGTTDDGEFSSVVQTWRRDNYFNE